jgi:RHS repeat-associated protein
MKKYILSAIYLILTWMTQAQPSAPSVNGLGYAKFVEFPISPFTGTFSYSVPIATVTSGSLSLPVSIDYHSGGNKVGDPASNVGLGWNLNYGGSITRTVRGLPDDVVHIPNTSPYQTIGYWFSPSNNTVGANYNDMALGYIDGEPDIFTWSAGGQGGKFYFDRNHNIVHITKTNAQISLININSIFNSGFKIVIADGTTFYYNNANNSTNENNSNYQFIIEWGLKKVESYDKMDSIILNYVLGNDILYPTLAMPTKHGTTPGNLETNSNSNIDNKLLELKLIDIVGSNSKISFTTSNRDDLLEFDNRFFEKPQKVDVIKYENGSSCINFHLSYDYFKSISNATDAFDKRLKLTSIQKRWCSQQTQNEPPIIFEYNGNTHNDGSQFFPKLLDKNIDHYGYYNKSVSENNYSTVDMIQPTSLYFNGNQYNVGNANRTPNFNAALNGMLKKITLPTKGTIDYTYEQNDYLGSPIYNSEFSFLKYCGTPCGAENFSKTVDVTQDMKNTGVVTLTGVGFEDCNGENYTCSTQSPRFSKLRIYNTSYNEIFAYDLPVSAYATNSEPISLSSISGIVAGNSYIFELSVQNCTGYCSMEWQFLNNNVAGPGIRIKQIKVSDGLNIANDIIKNYSYTKFSNPNQSSGFVVNTPKYGQSINGFSYVVFSAYSLKTLQNTDGFGIGYENVTIDYNGNGKEKLTFHKEIEAPTTEYPPKPNQVLIGRPLISETLDNNNIIKSNGSTTYNSELSTLSDYFHQAFVLNKVFNILCFCQVPQLTAGGSYRLKTNRYISVSSEVTTVDGVTTTTNHTYNTSANPPILGPIESNMTNSDGKVTKTKVRYTSQYDPDASPQTQSVKNAFLARNINIPYQTIVEVDGNDLSGSRTLFALWDNNGIPVNGTIPRPQYAEKYERTWNSSGVLQAGSWTRQKTFNAYAHKGKLTSYFDDGYNTTILGYDPNNYNIISKTYDAHTTTYEYYLNSTLLKKVTDIDGTSVSYEYDNLLRLWKVIDNSKLITKTYSYYFGNGTSGDRHKTTAVTTFQGASNANSQLTTLEDITYYDNLERPIQLMKKGQSPTNKDIVVSMEYDKYGRLIKEYLPVEGIGSTGTFMPIQATWKHSLTTYESSPLSRKLSTLPPDWYATTYEYGSNTTAADGTITDPKTGDTYPQNSLYKTITIDPHNNKTISFTDKKGRTILSASYNGTTLATTAATDKKITIPVYDLKDRTEAVVVPGATWSSTELNYYYRYDGDDKMIYKKLPSRGDVHYVYNSKDLVAGWRDNNLGSSKWLASQYDVYGRLTKSGFVLGTTFDVNTPAFSEAHTETIYGTTGIEKGKVKTDKSLILGTSTWLQTTYTYDAATGRLASSAGNHHLNTGNTSTGLTAAYIYDKGGNVTNTNTGIIPTAGGANLPVNHINKYDHIGRNIENNFQYNGGTMTTLSKQVYNHREELITKYQGKTSFTGHLEYLQEINYSYLTNGLLSAINQYTTGGNQYYDVCSTPNPTSYGTYNDKDIFHLKLHYDTDPITIWGAGHTRKNGEISHAVWQVKGRALQAYRYFYDHHGQMTNAAYFEPDPASWGLIGFTNRYSETVQYDQRGNITNLTRYGVASPTTCGTAVLTDQLTYNYGGQTGNRVHSIVDAAPGANGQLGFKPAAGNYTYDANGNITADPYKGITSIMYNHFDKPTRINKSNGWYITFTYDGSGGMLTKSIFNNSNVLQEKRDYIGNFEYVGGVLESVMHSEGRYRSATARHEYTMKDHLGNTRLVYSDANNDGIITVNTEILQETHYYPFGLEFQGHYIQQSGFDYRYKYNDIERLKDLDVGIDMAFYRGLDPTTGRWMQVDPLAEIDHSGSPYRHAFNNPISFNDSDGDTPVHAVAAVIGAGINVFNNWDKVLKNPWSAIGYAATGAVAGAASLAPGGAIAAAKITAAGNLATDIVSGNIPDIKSVEDAFGYVANSAMNALDVAGAGKLAKAGLKGLGKLGIDWATEAVHATGEWAFSEVTSELVGSKVDDIAFGTVVTDYKMEWVVKAGVGPIGFGSTSRVLGVASPNGGSAPQHGGTVHNDRIDKWAQKVNQPGSGVSDVRKNQQQVDINGNRVGTNRPDLQFNKGGKHYNLEWDNSARASARHRRVVTRNDSKAISKFFKLFK